MCGQSHSANLCYQLMAEHAHEELEVLEREIKASLFSQEPEQLHF